MDVTSRDDPKTHAIIGAAMEVHRELGPGFLEAVYQEALSIELAERNVPFERESIIPVSYKENVLSSHYRADFICFGDIIVELKTAEVFDKVHLAQVLNYLKATELNVGVLINFKSKSLEFKRIVYNETYSKS